MLRSDQIQPNQEPAPAILIPLPIPELIEPAIENTSTVKEPEFKNALDAYKAHLDRTVRHALNQEYKPAMNPLAAIIDGFYHDGKVDYKTIGIFASSLVIGGLSSIFSAKPAGDAAKTIVHFIEQKAGVSIPIEQLVVVVFQAANVGEVVVIASVSAMAMLQAYLNKKDTSVKYLSYEQTGCVGMAKKVSRGTFNLLSAFAANIPTFLLTKEVSLPLAILTSIASMSISWRGVSNLQFSPARLHPARKIEALYLHDQLETFLRLSLATQIRILDELKTLQDGAMDDAKYRQFYARLLNLSKPAALVDSDAHSIIQAREERHIGREVFASSVGVVGVTGQLTWPEAAGVGVARLFPDPSSPEAITTGISMALLVLLPSFGFGYYGGSATGRSMISPNEAMARFHHPHVREAIKWLGNVVSALSGGAIFTLGL